METLLTSKDLADHLAVSIETVRWWRKQGTGPRAIKFGRNVRYAPTDVNVWLREQTNTARRAS